MNDDKQQDKQNKETKKQIILKRNMYYDTYDKESGDGFYPKLRTTSGICSCKNIIISFILINYKSQNDFAWKQYDNSPIYGFDKFTGSQLLESLNKEANACATKILNIGARIIYPVIPEQTTYKILEDIINTSKKRTKTF
uniref:Uncharacterized protein n=1 Tax=viral metagenome TaxID=1070528 RepID=A0A6C0D9Z1_9ZZZZ